MDGSGPGIDDCEADERHSAGRSAFYQYFGDPYDLVEALLRGLEADIFRSPRLWLEGEGDPVSLLEKSLAGLIDITYEGGPILKAVSDASRSDERLEKEWNRFLGQFDDAVATRIKAHQEQGLIAAFDARPVAMALNRMDASLLIQAFGSRPRGQPKPIRDAIIRVWTSTLYPQIVRRPCTFQAATNLTSHFLPTTPWLMATAYMNRGSVLSPVPKTLARFPVSVQVSQEFFHSDFASNGVGASTS